MKSNRITTIGVPRDVWSETLHQKINAAYATGEAIKPGKGMTLARAEVSSIMGVPIHYAAVIRFSQFTELIDNLEGVEVNVDKSFTDTEFPVTGRENDLCGGDPDYKCRYESISFEKGVRHMNGDTALKYVRSRHATGAEGSDFARNQRQQSVMKAIRGKIITADMILNPAKIEGLYKTIDKLVERDITNEQGALIARNILLKRNFGQTSGVLPREIFTVPDAWQYNGQYVLVPKSGTFDEAHKYVDTLLHENVFSEN
jgi:LCP family protein required for cell wall assembly